MKRPVHPEAAPDPMPASIQLAADNSSRPAGAAADFALMRRVSARDRAAFEQLYLAYHRRLSRFLMRFAHSYEAAEEIINDTMLVVWNKADEFRGQSQVSTWIIGIAYRRALKAFHHLDVRRRAEADAVEIDQIENAGRGADQEGSHADWLAKGMSQLSLEHRMTLELAYFLGHSCEEIATIAGCPVATVKTRMFHARQRLRHLLPPLAEPVVVVGGPR